MKIIAHSGVEHATNSESLTHALPEMLVVSAVIITVLFAVAYLLSKPKRKTSKDEDEA